MQNQHIDNLQTEQNFLIFLEKDSHSRIFFSGRFGVGKTYFLKNLFNKYKDHCDVYHLLLAQYQLDSNENILDYLKHDLVLKIYNQNKNIAQSKKSKQDKIVEQLYQPNGLLIFHDFNPLILSKLDQPLEGVKAISQNSTSGQTQIRSNQYLEEFLTNFIGENKQKTVLIIDDLDKIEIQHALKILNLFSNNTDSSNTNSHISNKFGFNHIIFSGGYENIKNMFFHQYGALTDFSGYFNKFITKEVFNFDNKSVFNEYMALLGQRIENMTAQQSLYSVYGAIFLTTILNQAINLKLLNLRQIIQVVNSYLKIKNYQEAENKFFHDYHKRANVEYIIFYNAINCLLTIHNSNKKELINNLNLIKDSTSVSIINMWPQNNIQTLQHIEYGLRRLSEYITIPPNMIDEFVNYKLGSRLNINNLTGSHKSILEALIIHVIDYVK